MDVEEIRVFINYIANKHQTGNTFTPVQYNNLLPRAQNDFIRQRYGLPHNWKPGQPIPQMGWEITQLITDDLKVLKEGPTAIVVDVLGQYIHPANYWHHSSLRHDYSKLDSCDVEIDQFNVPIRIVDDARLGARLSSQIKPPTKQYPIAVYYDTYIQFYPIDLTDAVYTYLRYPVDPVWGSTIVNDEAVYDVATSTQIELPDHTHIEIARIILGYVGINLLQADIVNYAERAKTVGI